MLQVRLSLMVVLLQQDFMNRGINFYENLATYLNSFILPPQQGQSEETLELPDENSELSAELLNLPEWYLEDIGEYLVFILKYYPPNYLTTRFGDSLMLSVILVLSCQQYTRNPFIKEKAVRINFNCEVYIKA